VAALFDEHGHGVVGREMALEQVVKRGREVLRNQAKRPAAR
jgi:hypothetical protein